MLRSNAPPASDSADHSTIALRRRAFVSHEGGELKLAELLYREVLCRYPEDLQVRRALGILALQTQRCEWALQLLTEVYRYDQSAAVNDYIGNALCGLNRLEEALKFHERALKLEPTYASAQLNRARVLRALAEATAAQEVRDHAPAEKEVALQVSAAAEIPAPHSLAPVGPSPVPISIPVPIPSPEPGASAPSTSARQLMTTPAEDVPERVETGPSAEAPLALEQGAPATTDAAQDAGETARAAAEMALITSERALAATVGAEYLMSDSASVGDDPADALPWSNVLSRAAWRTAQDHLAPRAVSFVLALLLCAEVVHAARTVVWHDPPPRLEPPLSAMNFPRPPGIDVTGIVASHLFGEVPSGQDILTAPRSAADLKLTGTFATQDPRHGWAIIADPAKSHVYSIGDSFGNVSLVAIYRDHVVISRNGAMESLFLPRQGRDPLSVRPAAVALASQTAAPAAAEEALIDRFADSNLETDVSGSLLGIRVVPGKDRQAFANSGLIGGDIVVELNGMKLDSDRAQEAWKQAGSGSTVTVLRRGVLKQVTLNLSP